MIQLSYKGAAIGRKKKHPISIKSDEQNKKRKKKRFFFLGYDVSVSARHLRK